jgi:uncharacterized protein YaiI (UPF0178 family)
MTLLRAQGRGENAMRLIMDGDGLPFIDATAEQARRHGVEFYIVTNDRKRPLKGLENAWITVPTFPNSADIVILDMLQDGDILLTDDRDLAAHSLDLGATPLRSDGAEHVWTRTVFPRRRKQRAMSADERVHAKEIKRRVLELRLANALADPADVPPEDTREEYAVSEEPNSIVIGEFYASRLPRRQYRGRRYKRRVERAARKKMIAFEDAVARSRVPRPKIEPYAMSSACSREIREIIGEYEMRYQNSRKAPFIDTWRYNEEDRLETAKRDQELAERNRIIAEQALKIAACD